MSLDDIRSQMNSKRIETKLRELSGTAFEEHARFLLLLINKKYNTTRFTKDEGVDGFVIPNPSKLNNKNREIEIFSMYGRMSGHNVTVNGFKRKIRQDFHKAKEWAESNGYEFVKWNLVINFELDTSFKIELIQLCAENNVDFEETNPSVLVSKIRGRNTLFEAATYFHTVDAPQMPYSSYSNHKLAEVALLNIVEAKNKTTDEKFEVLTNINTAIYQLMKENQALEENRKLRVYISLPRTIKINTRVLENYIYDYKYIEGLFIQTKHYDKKMDSFFRDEDENNVICVQDLASIYTLCKYLREQLEQTGTFSIEKALEKCMRFHSWSEMRKRIINKDIS